MRIVVTVTTVDAQGNLVDSDLDVRPLRVYHSGYGYVADLGEAEVARVCAAGHYARPHCWTMPVDPERNPSFDFASLPHGARFDMLRLARI
ncbi:hypothetical protein BJP27_24045 (plasmid) [Pseudomonas oryzihabitans]|nr:hypothetical protein BJP27_24045 [Pseudomonas psychrotolerans]